MRVKYMFNQTPKVKSCTKVLSSGRTAQVSPEIQTDGGRKHVQLREMDSTAHFSSNLWNSSRCERVRHKWTMDKVFLTRTINWTSQQYDVKYVTSDWRALFPDEIATIRHHYTPAPAIWLTARQTGKRRIMGMSPGRGGPPAPDSSLA